MWIVQEVTVARDIVFLCGSDSVSAQVLREAQRILNLDFLHGRTLTWHCLPLDLGVRSFIEHDGVIDFDN
jgi:hypothetical protein